MSTGSQFKALCEKRDFIPEDVLAEYEQTLREEDDLGAFSFALRPFITDRCPGCYAAGAFRTFLLGRLKHSSCGTKWFTSPWGYARHQLHSSMWAGAQAAHDAGGQGPNYLFFFIGLFFRCVVGAALLPIQTGLYLYEQRRKARPIAAQAQSTPKSGGTTPSQGVVE